MKKGVALIALKLYSLPVVNNMGFNVHNSVLVLPKGNKVQYKKLLGHGRNITVIEQRLDTNERKNNFQYDDEKQADCQSTYCKLFERADPATGNNSRATNWRDKKMVG